MSQRYTNVLVGTDGSETAQCAVYSAASIARSLGVTVTVITSWYRGHDDTYTAMAQTGEGGRNSSWATDVVVDAGASLRMAGYDEDMIKTRTPEGGPADVLVQLSDETPGTLIVVGTVGLDSAAERILGNIPNQLTHHAASDILLVHRRGCDADVSWSSMALATDGSKTAAIAVEHGGVVAKALGAATTLLTVANSEDAGAKTLAAAAALPGGVTDEQRVVVAKSAKGTLSEASADYDMLVIGNKGMSGPSRLLGSVASSVTHALPTDILLVNTTR